MKPKKKLSKIARKKEATGINIEAAKARDRRIGKRLKNLETRIRQLEQWRKELKKGK